MFLYKTKKIKSALLLLLLLILLASCSNKMGDLEAFIAEVKARPRGAIEALPEYPPYQTFTYNAMSMRAPFDQPVEEVLLGAVDFSPNVKPDNTRQKDPLEEYNIEQLTMVGTLGQAGERWALVRDPEGKIHRVSINDYLGRNHGRVLDVQDTHINILELMSAGGDLWKERPRSIRLAGLEEG